MKQEHVRVMAVGQEMMTTIVSVQVKFFLHNYNVKLSLIKFVVSIEESTAENSGKNF